MTDELAGHGLYRLSAEVRARKLARMGMTEEEYREKLKATLARDDSKGHGWSTKEENPGWSDDPPTGQLVDDTGKPVE